MIATKALVLNSIKYCSSGDKCEVVEKTKKYHTFRRTETKVTEFKVSNELVPKYFREEN